MPASLSALSLDTRPVFLDLLALPHPLVLAIFDLLPVDTRLRCSEVNRAWRALLADATFWKCLKLAINIGWLHFSLPLLRAAAAKAGGQLRVLDITELPRVDLKISNFLFEVVTANATTLTELRVHTAQYDWPLPKLCALLRRAPALQFVEASMTVIHYDHQVARAMLRNEPPFQALRLRRLSVDHGFENPADVVSFSLDLRGHASLEELYLNNYRVLNTDAPLGAVVDACIAIHLPKLVLHDCRIVPVVLPHLTRLIAAGALRNLDVSNFDEEMFDEAHESTRLFVAAVRASDMTRLRLRRVGVLPLNVARAAAFINARQQERSLK